MHLTQAYLDQRTQSAINHGWNKPRWIEFAEAMLARGYSVSLYEARETVSKYLTVWCVGKSFKVRYSNHRPNREKQRKKDCDFFVGITHQGPATTTEDAIKAAVEHLGECPLARFATD